MALLGGVAGWGVGFPWYRTLIDWYSPMGRSIKSVIRQFTAFVPSPELRSFLSELPYVGLLFFPAFAASAWLIQRFGVPHARLRLPRLLLVSVFASFLCAATGMAFFGMPDGLRRALSVLCDEPAWVAVWAQAVAWCLFWSWRSERMRNEAGNPRP